MYHKTVLKNGIRILSERLENYRSVSLGVWINVGSRDESEGESGISHFIEHMLFKGTRTRDSLAIAKELDGIGGLSNAFTSKEYTCLHARVLDKDLPILADILADLLLNSIFDLRDIDQEKKVILQEISMVEDTPDDYIHVIFNRLFWVGHPLGRSILGTIESVTGIEKEAMTGFMKRHYLPEKILVTAAGNVDHDELVSYFQPCLESLNPATNTSSREIPSHHAGVSCLWKDLEQVHLCLGGWAPELGSEYRFAGAVLNTILGGNMSSRLFQEIREKRGLAYAVYSFLSPYMDAGQIGVYVGTDSSKVNRVLSLIQKELVRVRAGDISESDLAAAKEHLIGGILLGAESTDSRMMRLAKNEHVFGKYVSYDEIVADLGRVTVEEVVVVARDAFQTDGVSLTTLGPFRQEDLDLSCLRFPSH
ncbi:MAG: M16 family metallopeptidase [Desulfatiglandales bacterium]